jgi:DNA-binding XRE family transcriptional regulator
MSDFQKYLDDNLANIDISEANETVNRYGDYDVYVEIREALISLRKENHMTQKELANLTGMTQTSISNIEKGISKPTIETIKKIADALGVRLVISFEGSEVE